MLQVGLIMLAVRVYFLANGSRIGIMRDPVHEEHTQHRAGEEWMGRRKEKNREVELV